MRYFHNFYGQFQVHPKFAIIAGLDIGFQQNGDGSKDYRQWYAPVLLAKYSPSDKFSIAARVEYYKDADGVIIATETTNSFNTYGYSVNFDYYIMSNMLWRVEARGFSSRDKIFTLDEQPSSKNYFLTTALSLSF